MKLMKLLTILPALALAFTGKGIVSDPNIVQMKKVAIQFYGVPEVSVAAGGFVKLTAPDAVTVYLTGLVCTDILQNIPCAVSVAGKTFTVTTTRKLAAGSQFQFKIANAIDNPVSEQPTATFTLLTSSNESATSDIFLTCSTGTIPSPNFRLNPSSQTVGQSNVLEIRARITSMLPMGGFIFVEFPKWNDLNPLANQQKSYIQGSPICTPITVLAATMSCDFKDDRLIIYGGATAQISANSEIVFSVSGFKNPIETSVISGFKISTAVIAGNTYFKIDSGSTTLQVSDYASLSQSKLDVSENADLIASDSTSGVIQEMNDMQLTFFLPVPLNQGCKLTVILPSQYSVSTIHTVSTEQVFGFFTQFKRDATAGSTETTNAYMPLEINKEKNSFTISPCASYRENDKIALIKISQLKQPDYEKPTDSVRIYIHTQGGRKIAQIESDVTFTPIRGDMQVSSVAQDKTVQTETSVTFTIQPQHIIYRSSRPEIVVEFPSDVAIASTQCIIGSVSMKGGLDPNPTAVISPSCSREPQQAVRIKDFLQQDYIPGHDASITFSFGNIFNPVSTHQVDGLQITVYAFGKYAIDEYDGIIPWTLSTGKFLKMLVVSSTNVAYKADQVYTVTFRPAQIIPQNGQIVIDFPPEITIPDVSYSQSTCLAVAGFSTDITITCQLNVIQDSATQSHYQLTILNAFRRQNSATNVDFTFTLPGIRNPIQTIPTAPFKFATFTREGYPINTDLGASILMSVPAELQQVQVSLSTYQNSMKAKYDFTLVTSVPVTQKNYIIFTFPPEIILPATPNDLMCYSQSTVYISNTECIYDPKWKLPNSIRVELTLAVPQINALDRFTISFKNLVNPATTETTPSVEIRIIDSSNYVPINYKDKTMNITTNNAFVISKAAVTPEHKAPGVACVFTIEFTPEHSIETDGGLLITYPPQITPDPTLNSITVTVAVTGRTIDQSKIYTVSDFSARSILIASIVQNDDLIADKAVKISVAVTGLRNPFTNAKTDSFKVQSFNFVDGKYTYFIDKVEQGLFLSSKCSYPCKDCNIETPDICLSCYPLTTVGNGLPLLQLGKCVTQCATSRFYNLKTQQCDACDPTCLECDGTATRCTSCGVDDYLYFFKNQCLKNCPAGQLEDSSLNMCVTCENNCLTCDNTVNTCTSCNQKGSHPYLFHDNCLDSCTPNISVLVQDKCVECDSTCKTCAGSPTTCTSCESYMRFDPVRKICTQQCEQETQIFLPASGTCEYCGQNCHKCAGTVDHCTLCQAGYVLNTDHTCQKNCSAPNQIAIDGVCKVCEEPCKTCTGQTDHCTTCLGDFKLYLSQQCVQYCPPKYELLPPENLRCVYIGLVCPDGFQVNLDGDGCVPIKFECKDGYEINDAKTACVPSPGSPVPFPFLLCAIFVSFLVLGSYLKEKFFTKVLTNLISLIGMFEIIMYGLMVGYSIATDQWAILACSVVGLVALVMSNIAFVVYYRKEIASSDGVFQKWLNFFPRTQKILPWVCLLLNFKCAKMLYSGFFGLESSMAKFGQPLVFNRIMRMVTYFQFVFCYGAIYVADILIFIYVKWGFQLQILGIETFILQTLLLILTWREFVQKPDELLGTSKGVYTQIKPKSTAQIRVQSRLQDDSNDYEEGIPEIDEKTLVRSKEQYEEREINLRKMALNKILVQVGSNCKGVDIGAGLENCLSKFDKSQLKYRRAFSMGPKCENIDEGNPWDDAYAGSEHTSELADYLRERRYSWPLVKGQIDKVKNPQFERQIRDIKDAAEDYLIDNVYKEVKKEDPIKVTKKAKTVSRRTQTYLRELLQVEGEDLQESDMEIVMDEAAEIDETYAVDLISKVIQNISDEEDQAKLASVDETVASVKKATMQREIPDFELRDIMGTFEIDDLGNFIIIRGQVGGTELLDNQGRKVNRRGYLIDRFGNVINGQGHVIFKAIELDLDDEIPAPFGFEKRKKAVIKLDEAKEIKIEPVQQAPIITDMEDYAEKANEQLSLNQASDRLQPSVLPSSINSNEKKGIIDVQINKAEDELIDQLTKQKIPKKQKVKQGGVMINNMPPKRFKPEDLNQRFPMLGIDNTEQRRLAKIASQIGGVADQMQQQQNKFSGKMSEMISDQERYEFYKQQQMNEIINSEGDEAISRLEKRPGSVAYPRSEYKQKSQGRPSTGMQAYGRSNIISAKQRLRDDNSLQRIYGNIDDLVGLEEQQINNLINQREEEETRIKGSRVASEKRMNGLENIYLNRQASLNATSRYNQVNVRKQDVVGRPTLQQFTDDPAELNVNTKMDQSSRYVAGDLADRLDMIQRNYINNTVNLGKQRQLGSQQNLNTTNELHMSEFDYNPATSLDHHQLRQRGSSVAAQNGARVVEGNWM